MNEVKKRPFDMSLVRLYEWGNLYWYEDEITVGFNALELLIDNQERTMVDSFKATKKMKTERLPNIPKEYRDSYEQQFFEDIDKTNFQLRKLQRYSTCVMIFSFIETSLKYITSEFAAKLDIKFNAPSNDIIRKTMKFLIDEIELAPKARSDEYVHIIKQKLTRNTIAHNRGIVSKNKVGNFQECEGVNLNEREIIIRPEYLKGLISQSRKFFNDLILLIDDKCLELKK